MEWMNTYIEAILEDIRISTPYILLIWAAFSAVLLILSCIKARHILSNAMRKEYGVWRLELLCIWIAVILGITIFGRGEMLQEQRFELVPFWSYCAVWREGNMGLAIQIVLNVVFFVPLGFALPLCFDYFRSIWRTVAVSAVFSAIIELIQGVFAIGLCEFDDVFHNTLGALVGYGLFLLCRRFYEAAFGKR